MADFDGWAEYYDLIHKGLEGEAEFYVGQAVRLGGKVLELGCGTGRIAIPMAMSGVDVTGLDNSKAMLELCRTKLAALGPVRGTLKLVHADMATFDLGVQFRFIAMAYRTFMHLLTADDQRRCLNVVHRHLNSDGVFILNTWAPRPAVLASAVTGPAPGRMRTVGRYVFPGTSDVVVHRQSARCDEFRQLLIEEHKLQEFDSKKSLLREVKLPLVRAWTTPREMDNLVRLCGFDVEAVFGDFDCAPFAEQSDEMIWVLRKKKRAATG